MLKRRAPSWLLTCARLLDDACKVLRFSMFKSDAYLWAGPSYNVHNRMTTYQKF